MAYFFRFVLVAFLWLSLSSYGASCKDVFPSKSYLPKSNPFSQFEKFPELGIPFNKIKPQHFIPAAKAFAKEAREEVEKIKNRPSGFNKTIKALESIDTKLLSTMSILEILRTTDESYQKVLKEFISILGDFSHDVFSDKDLFKKVSEIYYNESLGDKLSVKNQSVLHEVYHYFYYAGARFSKERLKILKDNQDKQDKLEHLFASNNLKEFRSIKIFVDKKKDLEGLPERILKKMKEESAKAGHPNKWLITSHFFEQDSEYPSLLKNRDLRERIYKSIYRLGFKGDYDNSQVILEIIKLRQQMAKMFGFKNYANYILTDQIAANSKTVYHFLNTMEKKHRKKAFEVIELVKKIAEEDGILELKPWDVYYYIRKYQERYESKIKTDEISSYFELNRVLDGMFDIGSKLFDIKFKETDKYSTYHEDVRVYEVSTRRNRSLGVLYLDLFARKNKPPGSYEVYLIPSTGLVPGKRKISHDIISTNIVKLKGEDTLLSPSHVTSLFHEFGHALHSILSKTRNTSLSENYVAIDLLEFPSQLMEKWAFHPETTPLFAKHYRTGETIPDELLNQVRFDKKSIFYRLRKARLGILDLAYHMADPKKIKNVEDFETKVLKRLNIFHEVPSIFSTSFDYIFSSGYSSAFYSYAWSLNLADETFKLFEERGLFHKETTHLLKRLLEQGAEIDSKKLYDEFKKEAQAISNRSKRKKKRRKK